MAPGGVGPMFQQLLFGIGIYVAFALAVVFLVLRYNK